MHPLTIWGKVWRNAKERLEAAALIQKYQPKRGPCWPVNIGIQVIEFFVLCTTEHATVSSHFLGDAGLGLAEPPA